MLCPGKPRPAQHHCVRRQTISGAPKPYKSHQDQQRPMLVADPSEHRQESRRWNVDAAADLNGFDQECPDLFPAEHLVNAVLDGLERNSPQAFGLIRRPALRCDSGKRAKCPNSRIGNGRAAKNARCVALSARNPAVVAPSKTTTPGLPVASIAVFSAASLPRTRNCRNCFGALKRWIVKPLNR